MSNIKNMSMIELASTDCVKDRLAAYYHWDDNQSLTQAIWVAKKNDIDIQEIKKWSKKEKSLDKFLNFLEAIK